VPWQIWLAHFANEQYPVDVEMNAAFCPDKKGNVHFGSKADMTASQHDVRFTPKADIPRGECMSALCQKRTSRTYSITSSAISSKSRLIVRPSAFAVFRFITSSNLVGCCTGNSAGFAPLRILSK
jgi:hypothetical protein